MRMILTLGAAMAALTLGAGGALAAGSGGGGGGGGGPGNGLPVGNSNYAIFQPGGTTGYPSIEGRAAEENPAPVQREPRHRRVRQQ